MPQPKFTLFLSAMIFVGSGAGGLLRYWLGGALQYWWGPPFPFGTFVVNVSGCLAMGFLATVWSGPGLVSEEYRAAVLVGVLGGYTTFSSFGRETLGLVRDGHWTYAGGYVVGSVVLSLLAVWLGAAVAVQMFGTETS